MTKLIYLVDSHFTENGFFGKVSQQTRKLSQHSRKLSKQSGTVSQQVGKVSQQTEKVSQQFRQNNMTFFKSLMIFSKTFELSPSEEMAFRNAPNSSFDLILSIIIN